jgi:energy-converting hydrogenase Eha subunit A
MIDYNRLLIGICIVIGLAIAIVLVSLVIATFATLHTPTYETIGEQCHTIYAQGEYHLLCR